MSKKSQGIEVWVRVKPTKRPDNQLALTIDEGKVDFSFKKDGLKNLEVR